MLDRLMNREADSESSNGRSTPPRRRPVIGLALGGGAARGFAHIGIVRTLIAHGITPDVIVGTSIGAVVGGVHASGHLDALETWARGLQPRNIFGYLDIKLFENAGIGVSFRDYKHPAYAQMRGQEFVSHMSAVDLLFNHGPESRDILLNQAHVSQECP